MDTNPTAQELELCLRRKDCDALIFDLDGVLTKTARVHQRAWKEMFDAFLSRRAGSDAFEPFTAEDYQRHVDGKPRYDGVRDFLSTRGIALPEEDDAGKESIRDLGDRKNRLFLELLERDGVEPWDDGVDLAMRGRSVGMRVAVVSSSRNCRHVLEAAGLASLVDERVDGVTANELNLTGKPAPDIFLEAARRLGVKPSRASVFEDAESGVEAGSRGGFGLVVGVDRTGHGESLRTHGAHISLDDLSRIIITSSDKDCP